MDKILIIEDDPDIAAIERDYLELSGCAVTICANGTDGQRAALEGAFDLILLDLMCSRGRTGFPSAAPCAHRRTSPSSWSRRSARTPTRSTASASARTTTSKSPSRRASSSRAKANPAHPQLLQTVWGVGYRLRKDNEPS